MAVWRELGKEAGAVEMDVGSAGSQHGGGDRQV
jgi:hypothetical protein